MVAPVGWTIEEYRKLPEDDGNRYEIIDGELFVTPSPTWRHQSAVGRLLFDLRTFLNDCGVGMVLPAPADVEFGARTVVEPDLLVAPLVEGRKPRDFAEAGRLLLAIEVLSPGTAPRDRGIKRELYQRENVSEYWVVDLDARLFERWRPGDERPEVLRDRLIWNPEGGRDPFTLEVQEFFASLIQD